MIKKILFIQSFGIEKENLSDEILIWNIYLENYIKSKIPSMKFDLLYLPVEQKLGNLYIKSFEEGEIFDKQMTKMVYKLDFEPDANTMIGISGTTSNHYLSSKKIAEFFQKYYPKSKIVFGGAHASARPMDFSYKNSPIDYVIIGEGEIPLYNLVKNSTKKQDNPIIVTNTPFPDLNDLPALDFTLFDKYIQHFKHVSIILSRGCPFRCNFCMENEFSKRLKVKAWRTYSPKRAIQEVSSMMNYGANNGIEAYGFYDPIFGMNKKWLDNFLDLYRYQDQTYVWIETRLDILNESLLKKLDRKNFYSMYGLESYSKKMLSIMNKAINPSSYLKKFEEVYRIHQETGNFFMINILCSHPGETKESYLETFNRLEKMVSKDDNDPLIMNIRFYHHFTGTKVYNDFDYFSKNHGSQVYFPEWFKEESLLKYGAYAVRPSASLSLRDSIDMYSELYKQLLECGIKSMKKTRPENLFGKTINLKRQIKTLNEKKEKLNEFLDENVIEMT